MLLLLLTSQCPREILKSYHYTKGPKGAYIILSADSEGDGEVIPLLKVFAEHRPNVANQSLTITDGQRAERNTGLWLRMISGDCE